MPRYLISSVLCFDSLSNHIFLVAWFSNMFNLCACFHENRTCSLKKSERRSTHKLLLLILLRLWYYCISRCKPNLLNDAPPLVPIQSFPLPSTDTKNLQASFDANHRVLAFPVPTLARSLEQFDFRLGCISLFGGDYMKTRTNISISVWNVILSQFCGRRKWN
jgi:hypothetical protein